MSHAWSLYLMDGTRLVAAELDDYTFDAVLRYNAPGSWRMETALTATSAAYGQFAGYGSGVMLARDGEPVLVGVLEEREVAEEGDVTTLTLSGRDALVYLEDRWVDPMDGAGSNDDYDDGPAYSELTGAAETLIRHYVNVNLLGGGRADRVVPNFVLSGFGDGGRGGTATTKARFDNLLEMLQKIAATAEPEGVGLRLVVTESFQVAPGRLEFRVEVPRDLRDIVVFDRRSCSSLVLREAAPAVNAVLAAGEGEGTEQVLREVAAGDSISRFRRRIERFVDVRNESEIAALTSKANAELAKGAGGVAVEVAPLDRAPYLLGRDYDLGDRVGVEVAGIATDGIVREIKLKITPDRGATVTPLIGTEGATFTPAATLRQRALEGRLSHLERINQFGTPGMILQWCRPAEEIPVGWAVCDGGTYNGLATPDLRGRVPVGVDGAHALGAAGGALTVNLQHAHSIPEHAHSIPSHAHTMAHTHTTDIDHAHANVSMGGAVGVGGAPGGTTQVPATPDDVTVARDIHEHVAMANHIGPTPITSSASSATDTGTAAATVTGTAAATVTGSGGSTIQSIEQPWRAIYFITRIPAG